MSNQSNRKTYDESPSLGFFAEVKSILLIAKSTRKFHNPLSVTLGCLLAPRRRVLCKPHSIRPCMVLAKIFAANRYRPIFNPMGDYDFSIHVPTPNGKFVFNGSHINNSKTRVARAWAQVAGYALEVDPTTYTGKICEKSDANATHDGRVLDGPVSPDEIGQGKVYQVLVDNTDGEHVVDLRVTMCGGKTPLVYIKRRPIKTRFSNDNSSVELKEPEEIFSQEELDQISEFAKLAGLDYGEADILRDNKSRKIHLVDSTNGAAGPPNGLTPADAKKALSILSAAFEDAAQRVASNEH